MAGGVTCIIVTYNRKEYLKQCLLRIQQQTAKVNDIIVIDNNSDDGTDKLVASLNDDRLHYLKLSENKGGAYGFYYGIKKAYELTSNQYFWVMDDDTFPSDSALMELLNKIPVVGNHFGFLASNIRWKDGNPAVMNIPKPNNKWNNLRNSGLVQLEFASFVSLLINREAVGKVGLPIKEFFIWGDDVEYTQRISRDYPSYFVADSIVEHAMKENKGPNIVTDNSRISRYYYSFRNRGYRAKKQGTKQYLKYLVKVNISMIEIMLFSDHKIVKLKTALRGIISGMFFNPSIEYVDNK